MTLQRTARDVSWPTDGKAGPRIFTDRFILGPALPSVGYSRVFAFQLTMHQDAYSGGQETHVERHGSGASGLARN
jgi:hypothetical protein